MYQKFLKISILTAILAIVVLGCKKNPDDEKPTGNMQNVALSGVVTDINEAPISGVKVTTGTATAMTDAKGEFTFTQAEVINKRAVIKFEKSGYFSLTRSREKANKMYISAVLYPCGNSDISVQTTFDATKEKTLAVGNMKVLFQASSLVNSDGSEYSGTVNANMLYLDPNNENFAGLMPGGDLMAIQANGSEAMLISYGMFNMVLTDNAGNPLQLKSGSPAEATFPMPAGMASDAPASMPLWSFNEEKGIWTQEGTATLKGGVYVGMVTHFSWVNCDEPGGVVGVEGRVVDPEGNPAPQTKLYSGQTIIWTIGDPGPEGGKFGGLIPANKKTQIRVKVYFGEDIIINIDPFPPGYTYNIGDIVIPIGGGDIVDHIEMISITGTSASGYLLGGTRKLEDYDYIPNKELPTHLVKLNNFKMSKYEVTQELWEFVMGSNPSYFKGDDLPVTNVRTGDVQNFINKLNALTGKKYRLPTEAEWEYAARGGNLSKGDFWYSGSDNIDDVAWWNGNSQDSQGYRVTHPVGKKAPNELGLYDMSGNVSEWCSDWYGAYYDDGTVQINPQGPVTGSSRVVRGGNIHSGFSFMDAKDELRVSGRTDEMPDWHQDAYTGFRIVLDE